MSRKHTVAVAQYVVPDSPQDALEKLSGVAAQASSKGAQLVVTPETALGALAVVKKGPTNYLSDLEKIAKQHNIAIATTFYAESQGRYFGQGYVVSGSGEVILGHRKIYLAQPERDHDGLSPGSGLGATDSEIGKIGMLICKDGFNRYSHFLYERLNELKAELVCIPTWSLTWPQMDTEEYIKALYTYGSFESRAYTLVSGNLNAGSFGQSLIISPIRGVLQEGSRDKEQLLVETIDLGEVERARKFDADWQPKQRLL